MFDACEWFSNHLTYSAEGLAWAARQVPTERLYIAPPRALGEWPAARHIFHLSFYEEHYALPGMRQWLGEPMPDVESLDEAAAWGGVETLDDLLREFQAVRQQQVALLPQFLPSDWERTCDTEWGPATLLWVMTKTYQHTAEHIHDVLRMALFWDYASAGERSS